eukprot:gene17166-22681_t
MSLLSLNWATDNNPVHSPVLPPVRSQGICGACWAFATANAITAASRINSGLLFSLSPQELIDCDDSNNGCSGGDPVKAFNYVAHYGLGLLADYKYKAMDSLCSRDVDLTRIFIDGFVKIRSIDQNSIKDLLLNGPIATGICGTDQAFLYYQSGIFDYSDCCIDQNHAVLIVGYGYDSTTSQEYFILQNSWGTNWGESGYMRIARTSSGNPGICGFDLMPSYPVVPAVDPWPSQLHGLRLGKRLEKILSTNEFYQKHPDYVDALRNLGFDPSVETLVDDWNLIYSSLKVYKELYGNVRVPAKFVVPDEEPWPRLSRNMKLGIKVAAIRSAGRYVKDKRERKNLLDSLGFEWRLRDHTHKQQVEDDQFEKIYTALCHYKEYIDNDLNIPSDFEIPNDDESWPKDTWALKLGALVKSIREDDRLIYGHTDREKRLNDIGFSWEDEKETNNKKKFEKIYNLLVIYKSVYGNVQVPQVFKVPKNEPWPESSWGFTLGARVANMRTQGSLIHNYPDRRRMLDELGFVWQLANNKKKKVELDDDLESDEYDVSPITNNFRLTDDKLSKKYDLSSSGEFKIHNSINEITVNKRKEKPINLANSVISRYIGDYTIPMTWDPSNMFEPLAFREISAEAVREYMQAREYSNDPDIRQVAHFEGYLTPEKFHNLNVRTIEDLDIQAMKTIGYRILEFGKFNWNIFIEALKIYKNIYGDVNVPLNYSITEGVIESNIGFDYRFEEFYLGEGVEAVRIGDIDGLEDPDRKKQLDDLGFAWGNKEKYQRYRFFPMMLGLKIYRHLYGFPLPQYDFRVPDEPQWPYWMYNMPLGEWTAAIRLQQQMVEEFYNERKDILHGLEFIWWIPPGPIPDRYFQPLP